MWESSNGLGKDAMQQVLKCFFVYNEIIYVYRFPSVKAVAPALAVMVFKTHPFRISDAHLETLYNFGFNRLSLGKQDFDEEILKTIHRLQTGS